MQFYPFLMYFLIGWSVLDRNRFIGTWISFKKWNKHVLEFTPLKTHIIIYIIYPSIPKLPTQNILSNLLFKIYINKENVKQIQTYLDKKKAISWDREVIDPLYINVYLYNKIWSHRLQLLWMSVRPLGSASPFLLADENFLVCM